jgi:hypothetical protein
MQRRGVTIGQLYLRFRLDGSCRLEGGRCQQQNSQDVGGGRTVMDGARGFRGGEATDD